MADLQGFIQQTFLSLFSESDGQRLVEGVGDWGDPHVSPPPRIFRFGWAVELRGSEVSADGGGLS